MSTTEVSIMKKELIKRELETTPWDGLCALAKKVLTKNLSELDAEEIEVKCLDQLGFYCGDVVKSAEVLAGHQLVASTSTDVLSLALEALEDEYKSLDDGDIESLYKIFMQQPMDGEIDSDIEIEVDDQFIIIGKSA